MSVSCVYALPLGSSSFSTMRSCRELYVDKTAQIFELCNSRAKIFLARPRCFGKSLLVSTIMSLFRDGLRDFHGLAIESLWTDRTYPVIRLDFSLAKDFENEEEFLRNFRTMLVLTVRESGLTMPSLSSDAEANFFDLLSQLSDSSVVLLIDEYDAPLTSCMDRPDLFQAVQKQLSRFYAGIKMHEGKLRFFFMTGITKLANTGIFSSFNNLEDVSLEPAYGTLLGIRKRKYGPIFRRIWMMLLVFWRVLPNT